MKKMKPLILLLAIAFGLTSCHKEERERPSYTGATRTDRTPRPTDTTYSSNCDCYYIMPQSFIETQWGYEGSVITCESDTLLVEISFEETLQIENGYLCLNQ